MINRMVVDRSSSSSRKRKNLDQKEESEKHIQPINCSARRLRRLRHARGWIVFSLSISFARANCTYVAQRHCRRVREAFSLGVSQRGKQKNCRADRPTFLSCVTSKCPQAVSESGIYQTSNNPVKSGQRKS
jgi:hypothetical protein